MAKLVLSSATEIVQAAIKKANEGHYCLTKLLFSLAGIYPAPVKADLESDESLAEFFCKQLGVHLPEPEPDKPKPPSPAEQEHSLK